MRTPKGKVGQRPLSCSPLPIEKKKIPILTMEIEKMMASKLKVGKESCSNIPNPKYGRGLHKPHIFALQEGKMF